MATILQKILNLPQSFKFPSLSAFPVLAELFRTRPAAEIYLVGGAVRDILLGKKITDSDFVVRNIGGEELEDFLAARGRVVFAGKRLGVWKFREIDKREIIYDIALPRTEFSLHKAGLYRDFQIQTDPRLPIAEDLQRRDFTVNAMAFNLISRELIDPYRGQEDLRNKIIRSVGLPAERFKEDYSRLLRALRFSLQLGFAIEEETWKILRRMMIGINDEIEGKRVVPYEVAAEEFLKSFSAGHSAALELWDASGALAEIAPELLKMKDCPQPANWHKEGDVWQHTKIALANLSSPQFEKEFDKDAVNIELVMAVLFHDLGKPYTIKTPDAHGVDRIRFDNHDQVGADLAQKILGKLRVSSPPDINVDPARVGWLIRHHMLAVNGDPAAMRPTTIEKYFFDPQKPSLNLRKLMLVDGLATVGEDGKGMTNHFLAVKKRVEEISESSGSRGTSLVAALINGHDVIAALECAPGPIVGEILEKVRQEQLAGKIKTSAQAKNFLQEHFNKNESQI